MLKSKSARQDSFSKLNRQIIACRRCPRLVEYRERIAHDRRRAYRNETYWGRPIPGFGDPQAGLLIVGLAPAAHGGNRTGRAFTGDLSGDWLYAALYRAGFANQPQSISKDDGLVLRGAFITAPVRCAPPDNKPLPEEFANCREYLDRDMALLPNLSVIIALGKIAFDHSLAALARRGTSIPRPRPVFGHNLIYRLTPTGITLITSYHPSRRNTQTGLLTAEMFDLVFARARQVITSKTHTEV